MFSDFASAFVRISGKFVRALGYNKCQLKLYEKIVIRVTTSFYYNKILYRTIDVKKRVYINIVTYCF